VEKAFDLLLWSVAGALSLAVVGAPFGAFARAAAQRDGRVSEKTLGQAIRHGLVSGTGFFGCFGLVLGAIIGWTSTDVTASLRLLLTVVTGAFLLTVLAVAFAGLGYFCVWLGVRGTGILLALGIGVAPAGLVAPSLGWSAATARAVQIITALLGTTTVLAVRLCSAAGPKAFEPWQEPMDGLQRENADDKD